MHYGKRLKEIMQQRHIKQEELADKIKVRQQNISNWFKNPSPPIGKVELICSGLGIEPYELWLSKEDHANKMQIPDHLVDFIVFFKKQKPEIQDLIMDVTFKLCKTLGNPQAS